MFNLNKNLSYAREKKKEEEKKEKEEEEKADVDLQKHYDKLYKHPHSEIKGIIIDGYLQYYCKHPHSGKKSIIRKHRKEDDIYNYGLI